MNIVIVGATQGLGLCLVRKFLEEGHKVVAGTLEAQLPEPLQTLQQQYQTQLLFVKMDVTDEVCIQKAAAQTSSFLGTVDGLCNVAGVLLPGDRVNLLHQCSIQEFRKTMEVNAVGAVIVVQYFFPLMVEKGKFFTITSEGVDIHSCGSWVPCYALSKTCATKMCGILNVSTDHCAFYAIHPGRMNTEMGRTTAQIEPETAANGIYDLMVGHTPISPSQWYIDYTGQPMEG